MSSGTALGGARNQMQQPARFAVLTAAGRGAIATVAVRGASALAAVARRFRPASGKELSTFEIGRVVFGHFQTSAEVTEELVVGLIAPDHIEIHCHGGKAAVEAICAALVEEGCERVSADRWAIDETCDPLAAAALVALTAARTQRAAAILLDQYRGSLRAELSAIIENLDRGQAQTAAAALQRLLAQANLGLHLTHPWKVVIAGRPNAGKSSLMNALLGYQRSIVWQEPGTTRDILTATTAIDGWLIELSDTAGLRTAADSLEAEGVNRAEQQIAAADLVIFVADATAGWDEELWRSLSNMPAIIAHNKCDLATVPADGRPPGIAMSATTGLGIQELCEAIAKQLVPAVPPPGSPVPFTTEQLGALKAADTALAKQDNSVAATHLSGLLG
jgi:tRNA modification GTPase